MALTYEELIGIQKKRKKQTEQQKTTAKSTISATNKAAANKSATNITTANKLISPADDIAPVKKFTPIITAPTVTTGTKPTDERTWFKKGSYFDDGYDRWDVTKTILGSVADVGENIGTGIIGMGEKVTDALAVVGTALSEAQTRRATFETMSSPFALSKKGNEFASGLASMNDALLNNNKKTASEFVAKDLYDEEKIAKAIISAPIKSLTGMDVESASVFGEKTDALVQSAGQLLATAGLNAAGVPWFLTTGATSFGAEAEGAFKEGATFEQGATSAAISAGAEILSEKLSGGIKFGGKTLDDVLLKPLTEKITNKVAKTLVNLGMDALGEGFEEVFSGVVSNLGSALYKEEGIGELLASEEAFDEYLESFIGGMVLGGVSSTVNSVASRNSIELSENEQKVVDKVVEDRIAKEKEDEKKVTKKKEAEIRNAVLRDMQKGYIDTDTIESVLGGQEYEAYKKISDKGVTYESKLKEAIEHYQAEYDTLNKIKRGDMTGEQQDRQATVKEKLEQLKAELKEFESDTRTSELKNKLGENVRKLVEGSKLEETYRELDRAKESFKADASKFEGSKHSDAAKKTLENAVKANANNTNRVRDLVELQATIAGDTGTVFDFRSGEQIKAEFIERQGKRISELESIPEAERTQEQTKLLAAMKTALEKVKSGETVINGVITDEGVMLNLDSDKLLNRTTGHEITHRLEKTGAYADLKEALFKYAESKGLDIKGKLAEIEALYDGVENSSKAEAELVSELVGDYLLTDYDFIKQISVENRNVFQRLWDEVKYLCKVASAGSKEARQFERVKRNFEKAYKEAAVEKNNTAEGGVNAKYSLSANAESELHKALYDKNYRNEVLLRDETPEIMLSQKGVKNHKMVMNASHIRENVFTEAEAQKLGLKVDNHTHYHGIGEEYFLKIIDSLDNVKEAYRGTKNSSDSSRRENYFLLVTEFKDDNGNVINVPVFIDEIAQCNRVFIQTNKIATVFGRDNFREYINRQIREKSLIRVNNKSNTFSEGDALIAPAYESIAPSDSIPNSTENVKKKDIFGFEINENADVDEDLLEELSIYHPEAEVDGEGNVTVYHRTSKANAEKIRKTGVMTALEDALFFSSKSEGYASDYGDTALKFKIPSTVLRVNDIFDGEVHFDVPLKRMNNQWSMNVSKYLVDENANTSDSFSLSAESKNTGNIVAPMRHEITGKDFRVKGADGTTQNTPIAEQQELAPVGYVPIETKKKEAVKENLFPMLDEGDTESVQAEAAPTVIAPVKEKATASIAPIRTTSEKVSAMVENSTAELRNLKKAKDDVIASYSEKIAKAQAEYDAKKNKDTKAAQIILRRIERLKRLQKDFEVDYARRISSVEDRIEKLDANVRKRHFMAEAAAKNRDSNEKILGESQVKAGDPKKNKDRMWPSFVRNFVSKGSVFETFALQTKNRAVEDKYKMWKDRSESKAQYFMENGKGNTKSLKAIRDQITKSGLEKEFDLYMKHRLNVDRMKEDKPVFGFDITAEVSLKTASRLQEQHPEFKKWAKDVYAYNDYLRQMMVDGGLLTQETADLWAKKYPNYIPIERLTDESVKRGGKGVGISAPVKKSTGGNSTMETLLNTLAHRTTQVFKAIDKNAFGVELKNALYTDEVVSDVTADEIIDNVPLLDDGSLIKPGVDGNAPTFTVFENGKRVTFNIKEEMYEALKPTPEGLSKTLKVPHTASNWHKKVLTEYNLFFTARNFPKDAQEAIFNSRHAGKTYANMPVALKELLTGKGKYVQEYWENGGKSNTYFDREANAFENEKGKIKKALGFVPDGISRVNDFVEAIPRLAEYIASRKKGATIEAAMLDAARVTTDFSDGGDITKYLNRNGFTFLNASVQGAAQQVRNFRQAKANGAKGLMMYVGKYALSGLPVLLFNQLKWKDDEDYEGLSEYVKDSYYVIAKYGDGQFVRIPKGRTAAVIQEAIEQISNAAMRKGTDWLNFVDVLTSNLAPNNPLDNNILAPLIQAKKGETWYGEDLVPARLQKLPAREQYDEAIDSISKWLGENTGISPYKINYILNQYSGFIGDMVLPALTPEAENGNNSFVGNMLAPLKDQFTVDGVLKNNAPSDFFTLSDELEIKSNSKNATDEDKLKYKYISSVSSDISDRYKQQREIQNSNLSDELKFNQVREIQRQINKMAKKALNGYEDVKIDKRYAKVGGIQYRFNDEGEWQKLTDDQLKKQKEVTGILGITPGEYWSNKDVYDMKALKPELYKALQTEGISVKDYKENYEEWIHLPNDDFSWAANNPDKATFSKAFYDSVVDYRKMTSELYDIKADKDEDGNSISGSAKEKKKAYIWSLDIPEGAKHLLFRSEYNSYDDYNAEIIEYVKGLKLTTGEKKTVLEEAGFKVDDNGRITWD